MNAQLKDVHALKGQRGLTRIFNAAGYSLAWQGEAAFVN